jgi:hypothetical protein
MTPIRVTVILALVATGVFTPIVVSGFGLQPPHNKALQAKAAALFTSRVFSFIVPFGCAQALPSAAVPELGR